LIGNLLRRRSRRSNSQDYFREQNDPARYERMILAADALVRDLANIKTIALVDEAADFNVTVGFLTNG
jgi:fibrillarin-like rRNA methylase